MENIDLKNNGTEVNKKKQLKENFNCVEKKSTTYVI